MSDIKMEDLKEKETSTSEEQVVETKTSEETTQQNPLQKELDRVKEQGKKDSKTALEKASKSLFFNAKNVKDLGGDPASILASLKDGEEPDEDEDNKPVTLGMLKKIQSESATKTALEKADEIPDSVERELTKYHIENTIRSTGNAEEDFKLAQAIVNAKKNTQIIEEQSRKVDPKNHSSASGAPAKQSGKPIELTTTELAFKKQFGLTDEQIINARILSQEQQK